MRDRKIDGLQIFVCVKDNVALLFEKLNVPQKFVKFICVIMLTMQYYLINEPIHKCLKMSPSQQTIIMGLESYVFMKTKQHYQMIFHR